MIISLKFIKEKLAFKEKKYNNEEQYRLEALRIQEKKNTQDYELEKKRLEIESKRLELELAKFQSSQL